jgi:hypothetical protein
VFQNRVIRRIFGSKRDEVTGEWIKLHSEELHYFIFLPKYYYADQVEEIEVGETCSTHVRVGVCIQGFNGKARRKETA